MEHDHNMPKNSEPKQSHDDVAKKAYDIYIKEGRPKGHDLQNWLRPKIKCLTQDPIIMLTWRRISENGFGSL